MANSSRLNPKLQRARTKLFGRYSVLKNSLALTLLFLSFLLISSALGKFSDMGRLLVVLYGAVVLVLSLALIAEFLAKTFRAQIDPAVVRYSALASTNSFLGLVLPMLYFNVSLLVVMRALWRIANYDTVWCSLRRSLVQSYYGHNVYWQVNNIIVLTLVITIALFLWGGALEKMKRSN